MFRSKTNWNILVSIAVIFSGTLAWAEDATPSATGNTSAEATAPEKKETRFWSLDLGYNNWVEKQNLHSNGLSDQVWGSFSGLDLTLGHKWTEFVLEGSILFGTATSGGSSQAITYVVPHSSYVGASLAALYDWEFTSMISADLGVLAMYRHVQWQTGSGVSADQGPQVNGGLIGELKIRLGETWHLNEKLGWLTQNAQTYWEIAVGRDF